MKTPAKKRKQRMWFIENHRTKKPFLYVCTASDLKPMAWLKLEAWFGELPPEFRATLRAVRIDVEWTVRP
jgi:hypothetical protein